MSKYLINQLQSGEDTGYLAVRALFDCSTAAATQTKEAVSFDGATFTDTSLVNGMTIFVRFWYTNAAYAPKLKVGSSTAYPLRRSSSGGDPIGTTKYTSWLPYSIVPVTFLADCWIVDSINYDPPEMPRYFYTCSALANFPGKILTQVGSALPSTPANIPAGTTIYVSFTYSNTASSPYLYLNATDYGSIKQVTNTSAGITPITSWKAGSIVALTYYSGSWYIVNNPSAVGSISINNELVVPDTNGNAELTLKIQNLIDTKVPNAPATDGSYIFTANVSSGTATYSWENADGQYAVLLNTVWGSEEDEEEE